MKTWRLECQECYVFALFCSRVARSDIGNTRGSGISLSFPCKLTPATAARWCCAPGNLAQDTGSFFSLSPPQNLKGPSADSWALCSCRSADSSFKSHRGEGEKWPLTPAAGGGASPTGQHQRGAPKIRGTPATTWRLVTLFPRVWGSFVWNYNEGRIMKNLYH